MKREKKSWHGRTFDQFISKGEQSRVLKKNLCEKIKKTMTGPKLEEMLLTNIKWQLHPQERHIWICNENHPLIKNNIFYRIQGGRSFFCNKITWDNHYDVKSIYYVDDSLEKLFLDLYNVLIKEYYE